MKLCLVIPQKNKELLELVKFLKSEDADIYIFPEGFLHREYLSEALKIIRENKRFVITGYKEQLTDRVYEKALVIDRGEIVGEYTKCILTKAEQNNGKVRGESIHCISTKYGVIGIPICYELHFPEVPRVMAYDNPILLINLIGTGMYHDLQYDQWTALAKARAVENEVFVVGVSHFNGEIPLAFAYSPRGEKLIEKRNYYGGVSIEVNLEESKIKNIGYFSDRVPRYFKKISE